MRRLFALLVVLLAIAGVPLASGAVNTAFIESVDISPEQPFPGERFTVTVNIGNAESATQQVVVTDVAVRKGSTEYNRVENPGSIPPGSTISIPLTLSFSNQGTRNLRINVYGHGNGGSLNLRYPLVVTVRRGGPQLSVDAGDPVVGTEGTVSVTAANGEDQSVRNVRLQLSGENATVRNSSRVRPRLDGGASTTYHFDVTPAAGASDLTASMTYTTTAGTTRRLTESVAFDPEPLDEDVRIEARVPGGAQPPIEVDLANFGNAPIEGVALTATVDGETVARRPAPAVAPEASRSVPLNVSAGTEGTVEVTATYETGNREGSSATSVEYAPSPGRIELTGVDVEQRGDRVEISGSASNVGLSTVDGVVVRVESAEGVEPARPNREYFVGTVPSSDFVSFDLSATVEGDAEAIPIRVEYLADGQRRSQVVELDVDGLGSTQPETGGSSFPWVLIVVVGGLAAVAVLGVVGFVLVRR